AAADLHAGREVELADLHECLWLAILALLRLPIEPEHEVHPEERERSGEQAAHEARGEPHLRELLEVVRGGVGLVREKALARVLVALLAGLEPVLGRDLRLRIRSEERRVGKECSSRGG